MGLLVGSALNAGDNVTELQEIVGLNEDGTYLLLEKWSIEGDTDPTPYPAFFAVFRSFGYLMQFAEIPMLAGLSRNDMGENYGKLAGKKWDELLPLLRKAGFKNEGIEELKVETGPKGFSTVTLPDGRIITERGKTLRRKPNEMQEEVVSLWIAPKAGAAATLLKDKAIQTVVRSHSHREIQKAYWLKGLKTVVALYNNPSQHAYDRERDMWSHRFE